MVNVKWADAHTSYQLNIFPLIILGPAAHEPGCEFVGAQASGLQTGDERWTADIEPSDHLKDSCGLSLLVHAMIALEFRRSFDLRAALEGLTRGPSHRINPA